MKQYQLWCYYELAIASEWRMMGFFDNSEKAETKVKELRSMKTERLLPEIRDYKIIQVEEVTKVSKGIH